MLLFFAVLSFLINLKISQLYNILPDSLLNRTQICQINCTQNQTISDKFKKIPQCIKKQFEICEAYLGINFNTQSVSYSFTTADSIEIENENSSVIRKDLVDEYLLYFKTDITAIRFRQLIMKFSKTNPHHLNINYYCRTQIDDCAYLEIETVYPVYIANRHMLKRIQPIFYDESISYGTKIPCMNDISNEKTSLCSGYCTLTLSLHTMTKGCNDTLPSDTLGINISLGLAYPNDPRFTAQVSSLVLVCNKPNCNSNGSIEEVISIANAFLTAQSIGIRIIITHRTLLFFSFSLIKLFT